NRAVRHRDREAAALAHRSQDEKVADRLRHADARRNGMGVVPARRMLLAGVVGAHYGSAASRLHRHHARALGAEEADRFEFGERLPNADEAGAAAGRIEDHVRHLPAELLGELEAHGLLALDSIRLLERRAVEPADFRRALGDDLAAIIDEAVDSVDGCALQRDLA